MSPDFFNRCSSCDLVLSVGIRRREDKQHCPKCLMTEGEPVTMELVTITAPSRSRNAPRWARTTAAS